MQKNVKLSSRQSIYVITSVRFEKGFVKALTFRISKNLISKQKQLSFPHSFLSICNHNIPRALGHHASFIICFRRSIIAKITSEPTVCSRGPDIPKFS